MNIRYSRFSSAQRTLYKALYDAAYAGKTSVPVPAGLSVEEALDLMYLLSRDAAELCRFDSGKSKVQYKDLFGTKTPIKCQLAYYSDISAADQQAFIAEMKRLAERCTSEKTEKTLHAITEVLCKNLTYGDIGGDGEHFAYYAWKRKQGVCDAYSQLFSLLCHFSGIPCCWVHRYTLDSKTMSQTDDTGHAWNVASVDGIFSLFDITWSDEDSKVPGEYPYIWFGMGKERFYRCRKMADEWYNKILPDCRELHRQKPYSDVYILQQEAKAQGEKSLVVWLSDELMGVNGEKASRALKAAGMDWETRYCAKDANSIGYSGCSWTYVPSLMPITSLSDFKQKIKSCYANKPVSFRLCFSSSMFASIKIDELTQIMNQNGIKYSSRSGSITWEYYDFFGCTYSALSTQKETVNERFLPDSMPLPASSTGSLSHSEKQDLIQSKITLTAYLSKIVRENQSVF